MPHIIVEYSANIRAEARIPDLLKALHDALIAQGDTYPLGGIRSRAMALEEFRVADGARDYAFVHTTLKIGAGRDDSTKQATCEAMFQAIKSHFQDLFDTRPLALSLELVEFSETWNYKHNNIHRLLKAG